MTDPRLARPLWRGRTNVDAYTIAWIEHAEDIVRTNWPEVAHEFRVTKGSYQGDGVDPDSGTTHNDGGVVDLSWCGHWQCLRALRMAGGFAWHRTPEQGPWAHHIHGGPRLHPFQDPSLHRQELSYDGGGNGLGGPDDFWRPTHIPDPTWPWPKEFLVTENDKNEFRQLIREELALAMKTAGQTIKVDHDGDPKTARIALERWASRLLRRSAA